MGLRLWLNGPSESFKNWEIIECRQDLITIFQFYVYKSSLLCFNSVKFILLFQRQKKFVARYKSNDKLGFLGYLPALLDLMEQEDAFYEYRYDLYRKLGSC